MVYTTRRSMTDIVRNERAISDDILCQRNSQPDNSKSSSGNFGESASQVCYKAGEKERWRIGR